MGRRQSKLPILSRNVDQKSFETEFLIVICRHTDDKWHSKTLFLSIFDPISSIVDSIFDCRLPGVMTLPLSTCQVLNLFQPFANCLLAYLLTYFGGQYCKQYGL